MLAAAANAILHTRSIAVYDDVFHFDDVEDSQDRSSTILKLSLVVLVKLVLVVSSRLPIQAPCVSSTVVCLLFLHARQGWATQFLSSLE